VSHIVGAALCSLALTTHAESVLRTGSSPNAASAHVDFKIVIPEVLMLDTANDVWRGNARGNETVLVAVERGLARSTWASRADRMSIRRIAALAPAASRASEAVSYTVAKP
jgi:hypothetical protein